MKRRSLALALLLLASACAASDESASKAPSQPPATPVTPAVTASDAAPVAAANTLVPSIASVHIVQDCPDPLPDPGAPAVNSTMDAKPKMEKAKRKQDSAFAAGLVQPCTQSTLQLAISGQASAPVKVRLSALRLLTADGKMVGTLKARMPTIWNDSGYVPWDEILPPNTEAKLSYKLSLPESGAGSSALGSMSFGVMHVLEVDVELDGKLTTVRSPQFERDQPQIIKT